MNHTHDLIDQAVAATIPALTARIEKCRYWKVLSDTKNEPVWIFDRTTGLRFSPSSLLDLAALLEQHPFLYVKAGQGDIFALMECKSRLLWLFTNANGNNAQAREILEKTSYAGVRGWKLPTLEQLKIFAKNTANPFRSGGNDRLIGCYGYLTANTCVDLDNWSTAGSTGNILATQDLFAKGDSAQMQANLLEQGWQLVTLDKSCIYQPKADTGWQHLDSAELVRTLATERLRLLATDKKETLVDPLCNLVFYHTREIDHTPCRLPPLELAQLTDPNRGLWEFWGISEDRLRHHGVRARNPLQDVRKWNIVIDFGTSATVVALDNGGRHELLRIGVRDFYQATEPAHFENPTVLEFIDFPAFIAVWNNQTQQPALNWNWLRAAHEAQTNMRDNPGDPAILASILPRIKQWALRNNKERIRIIDQKNQHELDLTAMIERNPTQGTPMQVSSEDAFDPVELYAWYLGRVINWRGRGLLLKYYLTFPVKYERDVKNKILAAFRRGLQRSLPETLITQPGVLNKFEVTEIATEPAAYAAAALPALGLSPTPDGLAYAVFDFGGGTTDFDFGLWRTPSKEEGGDGYEVVFERLHAGGDVFLGGENLLENLAYRVFQQNIAVCREKKIAFTCPLDATRFTDGESLIQHTQAAQTNTVMLVAKLRPYWEGRADLPGQIKLDLLDVQDNKCSCEIQLDEKALNDFLTERIAEGARNLLREMKVGFGETAQKEINLLLAGNASRASWVRDLFNSDGEPWKTLVKEVLGDNELSIIIHPPLEVDPKNHHAPTAKTGVALGALQLCPGNPVLVLNSLHDASSGEAPFRFFVGRMKQKCFEFVLPVRAEYGQWHELSQIFSGVLYLFSTASPRARDGQMKEGDPLLRKERIDFAGDTQKLRAYVRAIAPTRIELCSAASTEAITRNEAENLQTIELE